MARFTNACLRFPCSYDPPKQEQAWWWGDMLILAARRLASMILIMIVISILLFLIFEGDKMSLAMRVLGQYSTMEGRLQWLEDNGYNQPLVSRYFSWLYGFLTGDW